jgi:hypothetical protein
MTTKTGRDSKGRFVKGAKGTSPGRPKKLIVESSMKKELKALKTVEQKIDYLVNYVVDNVTDTASILKALKDIMPFYKPKLKNIETKEQKVTKIEMSWVDNSNKPIDVTNTNKDK